MAADFRDNFIQVSIAANLRMKKVYYTACTDVISGTSFLTVDSTQFFIVSDDIWQVLQAPFNFTYTIVSLTSTS